MSRLKRSGLVLIFAATISLLTGSLAPAQAPNTMELALCRLIRDNMARLACFDRQFRPGQPDAPPIFSTFPTQWEIEDAQSRLDDSPQVTAALRSTTGTGLLMLRCREKTTEVALRVENFPYSNEVLKVVYRVNRAAPVTSPWQGSTGERAVILPVSSEAVALLRELPDDGKFLARIYDRQGDFYEAEFQLGEVSEAKAKIARACDWSVGTARARR